MTLRPRPVALSRLASTLLLCALTQNALAEDRLQSMPGHARYQEMRTQIPGSFLIGALRVTWAEDGGSFEYGFDGKLYRYTVATGQTELLPGKPPGPTGRFGRRSGGPARGCALIRDPGISAGTTP